MVNRPLSSDKRFSFSRISSIVMSGLLSIQCWIFSLSSAVRNRFPDSLPVFRLCSASRYAVHVLTEYALAIPFAS